MKTRNDHRAAHQRGAVLPIVILLIALLAAIATSFVITMRSHTKAAANTIGAIRAEALADAGVKIAMLELQRSQQASPVGNEDNWALNGGFYSCRTGFGELSIWVEDEGGKIDLNAAPPPLLQALFEGAGLAEDQAERLAFAVVDFRDADEIRIDGGWEIEDYEEFPATLGPKNRQFEIVDEFAQVAGIDAVTYNRLRRYLTVHSRRPGIDPEAASEHLIEILSAGVAESSSSASGLQPSFIARSSRRAFRIISQANTGNGSIFTREAIVYPGAKNTNTRIVAWARGALRETLARPTMKTC